MSREIDILVALDGEVDRGLIEALVARDPRVAVLDYLELTGPPASALGAGDALLVAVADYTSEAGAFVAAAHEQHPTRPILLLCPSGGDGDIGDAFNNGVDDIVALPTDQNAIDSVTAGQIAFALEKAVMRKRPAMASKAVGTGKRICVLGQKGGSGKTLVAINLAVSLAEAGHTVAVMDLDLQFGDVALAMGLTPMRTIYDLVRAGGSLDAGKLDDFLMVHSSGVRALLAPVRPDQSELITVRFLSEVERLLGEMFDFVVIDTASSFSPEVIGAVDSSTDVLVVAMRDTLALKNTKLGLETLERMEYDRQHVKLVLNRANTNTGIGRDDILAILGRDADILVPSHRDIILSMNHGVPIANGGGSEAAGAFRALAKLYTEPDGAELVPSRRASDRVVELANAPKAARERRPRQSIFKRGRKAA
jgi:pilus assembly protein CpaE